MTKQKVAVITRTKDRPTFLERAIASVNAQTYRDYIHVIVNDGGNKEAVERIVTQSKNKDKIQLFHRDSASGAPDTILNESIDRIDSEYFSIHDDDDTWHSEFLSQTVTKLDEKPALGAVVVRANKIVEEVSGQTIKQLKSSQWMDDLRVVNLYRQCIDNQFTPIATLFRRSAYQDVGKFDSTLPVVGDWEFGVRLLQKYDVDFIDPGYALANYHHRAHVAGAEGNTSFSGNDLHRYYTNLIMNRYLRQEIAEGRLGVGYIMNQLKYNQSNTATILRRFLPSGVVSRLKKKVSN